jgi:predicted short-subunit dehydrogenase-like oxidoreductase (DUF2520 family)
MRAWNEGDEVLRGAAERRAQEQEALESEIEAHGIELDPGEHRHGDTVHAHGHPHPHVLSEPGQRPVTGIVGAGAAGTALGVALDRAGWPVGAVASRDAGRRERFRAHVPGARGFGEANALLDEVELIILAVPDDAIAGVAGGLRLYAGQAMVHTSGLLGPEVLAPAMGAGTQSGTFHPLVAFADVERAVTALRGATIAIEGDEELAAHLAEMAEAVGGVPVRLPPGTKPAYHAAAVLAAGGVVGLLDTICEIGRTLGLDEAGVLAVYLPLVEQTLANARALGVAASLTGPARRGDAGTIAAHREAIAQEAPGAADVYRALLTRGVALAEGAGSISGEVAAELRAVLRSAS